MRIVIALALLLALSSAWGQQPATNLIEQRLKAQLGELMFANSVLAAENERLQAQITALEKQLDEARRSKE